MSIKIPKVKRTPEFLDSKKQVEFRLKTIQKVDAEKEKNKLLQVCKDLNEILKVSPLMGRTLHALRISVNGQTIKALDLFDGWENADPGQYVISFQAILNRVLKTLGFNDKLVLKADCKEGSMVSEPTFRLLSSLKPAEYSAGPAKVITTPPQKPLCWTVTIDPKSLKKGKENWKIKIDKRLVLKDLLPKRNLCLKKKKK